MYLNISKLTHFGYIEVQFFLSKKFSLKKNLVILGPKYTKWPKLKKYDIYGKKFKSSTNLYFQS